MIPPQLLDAVVPVIETFEQLRVPYFIGGSVASSLLGIPRTTIDADLVADLKPRHVENFVGHLEGKYYVSEQAICEAIESQRCFNVIHLETAFKVDVFVLKSRPYDQVALGRIRKDTIGFAEFQQTVFVAAPEDVVLNKLEWYRKGDEISDRQWSDAIGVLKVQRDALDFDYLKQWATQLGVGDLLERAMTAAGI